MRERVGTRKLPWGQASFNKLFYNYKRCAAAKGLSWDLSKDVFGEITKQKCYLCDRPPLQVYRSHAYAHGAYTYNGVDRVDNTRGYVPDNVRPCCSICNRIKSDFDLTDLITHLQRMVGGFHENYQSEERPEVEPC